MSYFVWLTSIDEKELGIEAMETHCRNKTHLLFDKSKAWTDIYDQVILLKNVDEWEFVCGVDNNSERAVCADPSSPEFFAVAELADNLNLFVIGEENEIYYIPKYGRPINRLDFELPKAAFVKYGFDLKKIIENSAVV